MRSSESLSLSPLRRRRRIASFAAVFALTFFASLLLTANGIYTDHEPMEFNRAMASEKKSSTSAKNYHRKLLSQALPEKEDGKAKNSSAAAAAVVVEPNRIWSDKCSKSDVVISQGPTEPLPNGIPTYTVEVMNVCVTGCDISAIHVSCGWFSSARLVNPRVFKRLRFNDCLVNGGKPLVNGRTLSFQYANTFRYPLTVSSVTC